MTKLSNREIAALESNLKAIRKGLDILEAKQERIFKELGRSTGGVPDVVESTEMPRSGDKLDDGIVEAVYAKIIEVKADGSPSKRFHYKKLEE